MEILIPISKLKTHCYQILDNVVQKDNKLIITRRGKPIVTITPHKTLKKSLFGALQSMAKVNGDIVNNLDLKWDAVNE